MLKVYLCSCTYHPEDSHIEWLKCVSGYYIVKLHSCKQSAFVGLFNKFYTSN